MRPMPLPPTPPLMLSESLAVGGPSVACGGVATGAADGTCRTTRNVPRLGMGGWLEGVWERVRGEWMVERAQRKG